MSTEQEKIHSLEQENSELKKILALRNEEKYSSKKESNLYIDEINLEAFSIDGNLFTKVIISKHPESDFVNISFVPTEGKVLQIHMTEKSYLKFQELIDVFKMKSINTRQFEE